MVVDAVSCTHRRFSLCVSLCSDTSSHPSTREMRAGSAPHSTEGLVLRDGSTLVSAMSTVIRLRDHTHVPTPTIVHVHPRTHACSVWPRQGAVLETREKARPSRRGSVQHTVDRHSYLQYFESKCSAAFGFICRFTTRNRTEGLQSITLSELTYKLHLSIQTNIFYQIEILNWVENVIGQPLGDKDDPWAILKSGVVLCKLMNVIKKGAIPRYAHKTRNGKPLHLVNANTFDISARQLCICWFIHFASFVHTCSLKRWII